MIIALLITICILLLVILVRVLNNKAKMERVLKNQANVERALTQGIATIYKEIRKINDKI